MYDLLLANGRVIDPSQGIDLVTDVALSDGRVAAIGVSPETEARQRFDVAGCLVTPGLIDLHTHIYWGGTSIGVDPNVVSRRACCTTMVDAGTAGAANLNGLCHHIIEPALPRILAFINVSFPGIFAFSRDVMVGECGDVRLLNAPACLRAAQEHTDVVVGVKARVGRVAGGSSGVAPLDIAIEIARELDLPVMAHLDHPPPNRTDVLDRLRPGDVLTHCFRPFPNAPVSGDGRVFRDVLEARKRGILFDIGHGMASFGFQTARAMLDNGFLPDTISSDVHALCIDGPAFDLLVTMSKFLALGMSLHDVVRCATLAPARALGRDEIGSLRPGSIADASILELRDGDFTFTDVLGEAIQGHLHLLAKATVISGQWVASDDR